MSNLVELISGYKVFEFNEVDSTMLTLKELALSGCDINTAVWAKKQNSGRGRHGREWSSPEGNLYISFLREAEDKKNQNIFAPVFIVAIAIANSIKDLSFNNLLVYEPSTGVFFLSLARVNKFSSVLSILNSNRYSF